MSAEASHERETSPPIAAVTSDVGALLDQRVALVRSTHLAGAEATPEELTAAAAAMNELLAESSDPEMLVLAAWMLTAGRGYAPDPQRARALLEIAAAAGDPDALFELYLYDAQGIGGPADFVRAMRRLRAAAHAGSIRAMANLGALHATGSGVRRDQHLSIAWYRRAADAGHTRVAAMLAEMFDAGIDAPHDARLAEHYAELAARAAEPEEHDAEVDDADHPGNACHPEVKDLDEDSASMSVPG